MFYLTMHSTHFIYGYMASDIWLRTILIVIPVVEHWLEREIAQWVHPMKDRSENPSHHEQKLLPQSYISLLQIKSSTDREKARHREKRRERDGESEIVRQRNM